MKISELIFVGIRGRVLALDKATGEQVWDTRLKGMDFVNVLLEGERVFASAYGEVFCLEALTGRLIWHNKLKGYGIGLTTIATVGSGGNVTAGLAEKRRRDTDTAAAGATSAAVG